MSTRGCTQDLEGKLLNEPPPKMAFSPSGEDKCEEAEMPTRYDTPEDHLSTVLRRHMAHKVSSPTRFSLPLPTVQTRRESQASQSTFFVPPEIRAIPSPLHEAPGQYIDKNERDGLPGTEDLGIFAEQRAHYAVRAHTQQRSNRISGISTALRRRFQMYDGIGGAEQDNVSFQKSLSPSHCPGGGVLSTLLGLYDQEPPSDVDDSREPSLEPVSHNDTAVQGIGSTSRPSKGLGDNSVQFLSSGVSPPEILSNSLNEVRVGSSPMGDGSIRGRKKQGPLTTALSDFFGLGTRPVQARNGGGVIGPLIASTGNITSPATPAASSIAPSVSRSGYHLSRYSFQNEGSVGQVFSDVRWHQEMDSKKSSLSSTHTNPRSSPHVALAKTPRFKWTGRLKAKSMVNGIRNTWTSSAETAANESWFDEDGNDRGAKSYWKKKRKKTEIYITRHVAQIIQRQEFILKLTRAMMMFGAPSHCLPTQIQSTARVLDISLSCMYLPDVVLISFDDPSTGTSQIKFIRQGSILDLDKLHDAYKLYWKVIHDDIPVGEASQALDDLMRRKQLYNWWQLMLIGGMCSGSVCTLGFSGSALDAILSIPLGALLVVVQLSSARNELYSNIFEISAATFLSFLSAAAASSHYFCYSALVSSSVVLILPGAAVLMGALEVSSRNIVAGSVRMIYAIIYSMFLGFGLAMGAQTYEKVSGIKIVGTDDISCTVSHPPGSPWYLSKPSLWWAFSTVPVFAFFQSLRNFAPIFRKEMIILILIACVGWSTNHFTASMFRNQSDMSAAAGAFVVGFIANVYARVFSGNAFAVMVTGMLLQLPSGLGNDGLMSVNQPPEGPPTTYISGIQTALQLVSVTIGLIVGLGTALVVVHPIPSKRRAVFSL